MNQLIKICDAFDINFLKIKYNDDDEEGGSCAPADKQRTSKSGTCHITISGMTCSACTSSIVQQLENLHGVHRASVSLAVGRATVSYDISAITPISLLEAVQEIGYPAAIEKQNVLETIKRLNQSSELLELKKALSSASICSTFIVGLEYLPNPTGNGALPTSVYRVAAYMALLLATKVQIMDAWQIHVRAWSRHGRRRMTMDTLLSSSLVLGIVLALLQAALGQYYQTMSYASSGSFLSIVILAGQYLEAVLKRENNSNLAALYELQAERETYELASRDVSKPFSEPQSLANYKPDLCISVAAEER